MHQSIPPFCSCSSAAHLHTSTYSASRDTPRCAKSRATPQTRAQGQKKHLPLGTDSSFLRLFSSCAKAADASATKDHCKAPRHRLDKPHRLLQRCRLLFHSLILRAVPAKRARECGLLCRHTTTTTPRLTALSTRHPSVLSLQGCQQSISNHAARPLCSPARIPSPSHRLPIALCVHYAGLPSWPAPLSSSSCLLPGYILPSWRLTGAGLAPEPHRIPFALLSAGTSAGWSLPLYHAVICLRCEVLLRTAATHRPSRLSSLQQRRRRQHRRYRRRPPLPRTCRCLDTAWMVVAAFGT